MKKNMMFKKSVCVLFAGILSGCSVVDERKDAYKDAELLAPLEVPPDLLSIDASDDLSAGVAPMGESVTLSEFDKASAEAKEKKQQKVAPVVASPIKQATNRIGLELNPEKVALAREGNRFWLVVPGQPEQLWNVVKQFWLSQEIVLEKEAPALGLMYTAWHEDKSKQVERSLFKKAFSFLFSTNLRDQYVVRFESSLDGQSTEVHVVHRGMRHVEYGENLHWLPREREVELEIQTLKRLALFIDVGEEQAQTLFAKVEEIVEKVSLQDEGEESVWLKLAMAYPQAWREIGNEILASGYEVDDVNRTEGVYFVTGNLLREIDKANVFAAFTEERRGEDKPFIVKLQDQGDYVRVSVVEREGNELTLEEKENFLRELQDELD